MTERLEAAKAQSQLLLGRPSSVIIMATGHSQYARNQGAMVDVCMQTSADGTTYKYMTMTADQCQQQLPAICEEAKEQRPLLWVSLRLDTDSAAAKAAYAHELQIFQKPQADHAFAVCQATVACRVAACQMYNSADDNPTMLQAWHWFSDVIALVNSPSNQTVIPALLNYTRTDQQVGCGIRQIRNSRVKPATRPLSYGRRCQRIGAALQKEAPLLFKAELTDLSSKALLIGRKFQAKRTSHGTAMFDGAWSTLAQIAFQAAWNYCN